MMREGKKTCCPSAAPKSKSRDAKKDCFMLLMDVMNEDGFPRLI